MKIKDITEGYKVTQSSPQGLELTAPDGVKLTLPPEKMTAIHPVDPANPNKLTMDPTTLSQPDKPEQSTEPGIKIGSEVEIPQGMTPTMGETQEEDAEENDLIGSGKDGDIGGDPTDELIDGGPGHGVVDREFERSARGSSMSNKSNNVRNVLPENDELSRWLTIARLR